jgi:hypothetical protein
MFLAPLFLIALPEPSLQSSASEAEIVPGSEFRSELTHRTPDKTGPLEQCVWLVVSAGGPVTLTLDSLDFDPALEVEIDGQGIVARDADTGPANDAWLVLDRPGTSRFRLHIRSEDGRGGEFVPSARAGRVPPPAGLERARQDSIRAEAKGERAVQRGDHSEAAKHFALASRAAFGCGDVRRARATAERELGEAEAAADPLLVLQAMIDLGSAEMRLGDLRRSLAILETTLDPARARGSGSRRRARRRRRRCRARRGRGRPSGSARAGARRSGRGRGAPSAAPSRARR